jgi:hypothetical protein
VAAGGNDDDDDDDDEDDDDDDEDGDDDDTSVQTQLVNKSLAHRVVVCYVAEPSAHVDTEELGSQAHTVVVRFVAEPQLRRQEAILCCSACS